MTNHKILALAMLSLATGSALAQTNDNGTQVRRTARAAKAPVYTGTKRGLIILVEFPKRTATNTPEVKFSTENARDYYDRVANELGFKDGRFALSVRDYFLAQSNGQFDFQFDVVGPYKLKNAYNYYGQNTSVQDAHLGQFVYDACTKAYNNGVDFGKYDWDGDGKADQVFILYAGLGENTDNDNTDLIWPQEGSLRSIGSDQAPFQLGETTIDTYAVSSELALDPITKVAGIEGIGTICHEFSHCFGLPDTYDKGSLSNKPLKYGTKFWDLMNVGNYLDGSFQPAGYTAQERMFCGWLTPIELKNDTVIEAMKPLSEGGEAYIIYNDGNRNEYYLLENRQQTGCDAGLYGSGLLITHVNYSDEAWTNNDVNTTHERYSVVPADNSTGYYQWVQQPDGSYTSVYDATDIAGDLYPYGNNDALTDTSVPADTLFTANTDGSFFLHKSVTHIRQNADGTIAFHFTNGIVDAIDKIAADKTSTVRKGIYSIDGRYLGEDASTLQHGLYIINGKKVVK